MLTILEYERNFPNVFVTYKRFGLPDVRIKSRFVDSRDGMELTRKIVRDEIDNLDDARRDRREKDEAL